MARARTVWTALAIVYVVWGSTYLAMRYLVETISPFLGGAFRFLLAGVLLGAVLAGTGGWRRLRISWPEAAASGLVGLLLLVGGNALVMVAEQSISSGLAALCVAAVPLFVVVLRLATGDRPLPATVLGVVVGFVGIATLVQPGGGNMTGVLTVILAAFSWSVGSFLSGRIRLPADPLVGTTYEMLVGGLVLLAISAARGDVTSFSAGHVSRASWIALAYLVVFGSLVAFSAYVWLLQSAPISTVSTYAYVNPAVAVLLGMIAGEALSWRILIGGALVIVAVAVVVTAEGRARARAHREDPAAGPTGAGLPPGADPGSERCEARQQPAGAPGRAVERR
ncbi:MAG: EamA family transporter [Frankiaceae bacterium]